MTSGTIAFFDFDGTLISKDSFIEFAKHTLGYKKLLASIVKNILWIFLWKSGICKGGVAKQHLFSSLYKGMSYDEFCKHGDSFAEKIKKIERPQMVDKLDKHIAADHEVYIVSASFPEWIIPWAKIHSIRSNHVLGTEIEKDRNGIITGRFLTPNCNGEEKVERIKKAIPHFDIYITYAYGNSSGDKPMMDLAVYTELIK